MNEYRIHVEDRNASISISEILKNLMHNPCELVILCIGTDRSTGDALGPMIGTILERAGMPSRVYVHGTLDYPVHATNLVETMDYIRRAYHNPFILAIDACLGQADSVGMITIGEGSLRPGAGVNKDLPSVGDLYFTGIVNVGGFMEYFVLQNTRFSLVFRMAETMAAGIAQAVQPASQEVAAGG